MKYPHDHENDVIYFGKTNFRNSMRKFGIKTDDRRRHMYVIGKTGMGKSVLLENLILSDIYAGHGACYIDPHGDTAEKLLDYIPSWRINDVVYFNPSDVEHPVGFNILEAVDESSKHLVTAGLMGVFKKIWEGVWSARMEYIMINTIMALMDTPGTTLLGINRMLSDKEYRTMIVNNIKDPLVKQFWVQEFAQYADKFATEAVAPIQNKVGQFTNNAMIRNIIAQGKSTMNFRKIMDDEQIFIVNLSKGRIGEDSMRLLGGMIITKLQMSVMERVDMREEDRRDFYMYVDEFQNFANESFASILSEARKYRLNLVMAHQYIAQLTEEVRDAVFGNVGTLVTFRVGSPDAVFMEAEFMPRFVPEDIINLPKYTIYLKLMIDGVTSMPFSAGTLPPIAQHTGSEARVVAQSRERYSGDKAKIEEHVSKWSGFGEDVDLDEERAKVRVKKKEAKKDRFSHAYDCTRCKKTFKLPVELDRTRPIYCEDCMPLIKEEKEAAKKRGNQGKRKREQAKKTPATPPKVSDGEVVVKKVEETASLADLNKDTTVAEDAGKSEKNEEPPKQSDDAPKARQVIRLGSLEPKEDKVEQKKTEPKKEESKSDAPKPEQKREEKKSGDSGSRGRNRRRRNRGGGGGGKGSSQNKKENASGAPAPAATPKAEEKSTAKVVEKGERLTFDV